jgi:predicted molibdopterin-dependent oxidoreductase YjgC
MKLVRLVDHDRPALAFTLDGAALVAKQGDTLLTAILAAGAGPLRESEFGDGPRSGFCLMGACQECWVAVEGRGVVRACSTLVEPGMAVLRR